jgi:hypothetical protein
MFMMSLSFYPFSPPPTPNTPQPSILFLLSSLKSRRCTQWILSLITSRCTGKLEASGHTQYRGNILINRQDNLARGRTYCRRTWPLCDTMQRRAPDEPVIGSARTMEYCSVCIKEVAREDYMHRTV